MEAIGASVTRLSAHPMLGRPAEVGTVRVLTIPRTPGRLCYSESADRIWIIAVWHGARQWPPSG
ncbi:type II toxin-antitoxin system RelE/ParE family toxin [Falsiroseomonas selenitidurans]|uniref:Type II toxin-antitoxin system RelE/ParE family toxin n=1 Tax=Falsiroseomonas selenitidurans TaxID=2716335 RepID=A0ABX1E9A3_9PROT|nr:type II toxin-antitoxin system RelE/ParE family toxin [Falsiroseomonas selenitidurans]